MTKNDPSFSGLFGLRDHATGHEPDDHSFVKETLAHTHVLIYGIHVVIVTLLMPEDVLACVPFPVA